MSTAADPFARATATRAHTAAAEALRTAKTALAIAHDTHDRAIIRPRIFAGLCALCGHPCGPRNRYCPAHTWAQETT